MITAPQRCRQPTPTGLCQHPVVPPRTRCWQHDGTRLVDLDAIGQNVRSVGWVYQGCVFQIERTGAALACLAHDTNKHWQVAESLGAHVPCDEIKKEYVKCFTVGRRANGEDRLPQALRPMLDYAAQLIPEQYRTSNRVIPAFFQAPATKPAVTVDQVHRWSRCQTQATLRAVGWLQEHGECPEDWFFGGKARPAPAAWVMGPLIEPQEIVKLIQRGVDSQAFRRYLKPRPRRAHAMWVTPEMRDAIVWLHEHQVDPEPWHAAGVLDPHRIRLRIQRGTSPSQNKARRPHK